MEKMIKDKGVHKILTLQEQAVWFKEHMKMIQKGRAQNERGNAKGIKLEDKRFYR